MRWFLLLALLAISAPLNAGQQKDDIRAASRQNDTNERIDPLEVRLTAPPRWEKGCLFVALDRINHSTVPYYLTDMGPYFDIALDVSTREAPANTELEWITIYGDSDLISFDAQPLEPGVTVHNEYCFRPTVRVVSFKVKTSREIPLRGELRVRVTYFVNKESWNRNRQWYSDPPSALDPSKPHDVPENIQPRVTETVVEIPCRTEACESDCTKPPKGLPDETRMVPDVSFIDPEMSARGKLLTEEFARKFPACSGAEHQPQ